LAAPKEIVDLVERFERNFLEYKYSTYNEAQTRQEFINPFFKALGWDMDNEQGFSGAYKEVVHEASLKVDNTTKAPDYAFKIGESIKFLVEAKKPFVNLAESPDSAYQLRYYAWNAKLPISILIDFEEFRVYDCRYPPKRTDNADIALLFSLKYTDYYSQWEKIADIFSKTAIQRGSFDKYVDKSKNKRGTKEVDVAFLEQISSWREDLAHNIAIVNQNLSTEELNSNVQATIDRIVFLRICEDRGIEKYGLIQEIASKENIYAGLCDLFKHADDRYNSGLFHFKKEPGREYPDLLALDLKIDDKVLRDITSNLYPPSPYNFAIISPEILGMVYEQFLGKVIRLTDGHKAEIEEKPEVKKAGGIKYTPPYIVQAIVRKVLGPLLMGKTPLEVAIIRVLDPACGSGSFLLVAYKYLLDWHLDWYIKHLAPVLDKGHSVTSAAVRELLPYSTEEADNDKSQKIKTGTKAKRIEARAKERASAASIPIYKTNDGEWHLTIAERKRILLNNVYGVDIDRQAVEVTKLSLLLKVLEGENQQTVSDLLKYSRERVLPDLDDNIKCGNSLIGTDIIQTDDWQKMSKIDQDRINPFNWETEFAEIMQAGGFHAIIGNPPYVRIQVMKEWAPVEVEHYKQKYASASKGNYDIYVVFVEKGLSLLNEHGRLGFILPHKFFNVKYGQPLRELIARGKNLSEIVHFGDQQVFSGATTYTCLLFLNKAGSNSFLLKKVDDLSNWRSTNNATEGYISSDSVTGAEWNFQVGSSAALFDKLSKMPFKLSDIAERIFQGIIPGADKVYAVKLLNLDSRRARCFSRALNAEVDLEPELLRKIVSGAEVGRFVLRETNERVIYPYYTENNNAILIPPEELRQKFPLTYEYFQKNSDLLDMRDHGSAKGPERHKYIRRQNIELQPMKKLAVPRLVSRLHAGFDKEGDFCLDNVDVGGIMLSQGISYHYILGLLNSNLINFYFIRNTVPFRGGFFSANRQFIENLPIRTIDSSNHQDVARHDRIISLVDSMLSFNKQLTEARTSHEQTLLQRQIEATDGQIDALVYELYGLTEEEIEIVEGKCV
jgi:type I restriction-modification system DNA methylase subunit